MTGSVMYEGGRGRGVCGFRENLQGSYMVQEAGFRAC